MLLKVVVRLGGVGACMSSDHEANCEDGLVEKRGVVGSAVWGRPRRGSGLVIGEAEEAKRPPPSRRTEPSLGDDMGSGGTGSSTANMVIDAPDVDDDDDDGCDGDSACEVKHCPSVSVERWSERGRRWLSWSLSRSLAKSFGVDRLLKVSQANVSEVVRPHNDKRGSLKRLKRFAGGVDGESSASQGSYDGLDDEEDDDGVSVGRECGGVEGKRIWGTGIEVSCVEGRWLY